jgi:hypothetical protein
MTNIYNLKNLQPGDRLVLPKSDLGFVQHHAIYIGNDIYGNRQYVENYIGKGVQMVNENHLFRDGFYLTRIEPFAGNDFQRQLAINRAIALIGKRYDLVNFNCEHYANIVQYNKPYSRQVGNGILATLMLAVIGIGISK